MKYYNRMLQYICLWVVGFLPFSCIEELDYTDNIKSPTLSPIFYLPFAKSEFTLKDFLEDGIKKTVIRDVNGAMEVTYTDVLASDKGKDVYEIPRVRSPEFEYTLPAIPTVPSGQPIRGPIQNFDFEINTPRNEKLDSATVAKTLLTFEFDSKLPVDAKFIITIPSIKMADGTIFSGVHRVEGLKQSSYNHSLEDFTIDFTGKNGGQVNNIYTTLATEFTATNAPIVNPRIVVRVSLQNVEFTSLFGNLNTRTFQEDENKLDIDFLDNMKRKNADSYLEMEEISALFTVTNSYGIPIFFNLQRLDAIRKDGSVISLKGDAVEASQNPYKINYPLINNVGEERETRVQIDQSNSNIGELFSSIPRQILYKFKTEFKSEGQENFTLNESGYEVNFEITARLTGKARTILITHELDIDKSVYSTLELSSFYIKTVNGFPFSLDFQGYFLDDNSAKVDSLFQDGSSLLKAAPVNTDGTPNGTSESVKESTFSKERFEKIKKTSKLSLQAVLTTTDDGEVFIKISEATKLEVGIGLKARLTYQLK